MRNKKKWLILNEREESEHQKIGEMIRKKDKKSLGEWLTKFSIEGSFWLKDRAEKEKAKAKKEWSDILVGKPKDIKFKKDDWL